jgi:UPF0716 protein FxsA
MARLILCSPLHLTHMPTMRIPVSLIVVSFILAEIAAFILVGEAIGVLATLGLVLFGMVAGSVLLRRQGLATLMKVQADLAAGRAPARPLAEGAVLSVAALLIVLPGFVSDLIGIALFVPAVREALWRAIQRRLRVRTAPREAASPARPAVLDLERSEYGAVPRAGGQSDSPWRPPGRPEA